ncbi:MAG TPA: hypothetical protein VHK47_18830 [Polyangia bacterium]|jgi:hypothetical protein|nr:hypothetical protein [Polyangia bacterium]
MTTLATLAVSSAAVAQEAMPPSSMEPDPATIVQAAPAAPSGPSLPWFGIMADAGIPDGMQGSIVLRPVKALRASIGGGYNMVSKGVRVGLTLLPFGRGPSAAIEAGRFFEGNANTAAARVFGPGVATSAFGPSLERIGYDFVNAHLGLDFGWRRVTFYVHGGMSYVKGQVYKLDQVINSSQPSINGQDANGLQISVPQGATVKYLGPSGKIGLIVYFG